MHSASFLSSFLAMHSLPLAEELSCCHSVVPLWFTIVSGSTTFTALRAKMSLPNRSRLPRPVGIVTRTAPPETDLLPALAQRELTATGRAQASPPMLL